MMNYTGCAGNHIGVPKGLFESIFSSSLGHSLGPGSEKNIYVLYLYLLLNVLCYAQGKQAPSNFYRRRNSLKSFPWKILHRQLISLKDVWGQVFFVRACVPLCPRFGVWTWNGSSVVFWLPLPCFFPIRISKSNLLACALQEIDETSFEVCWYHLQKLSPVKQLA